MEVFSMLVVDPSALAIVLVDDYLKAELLLMGAELSFSAKSEKVRALTSANTRLKIKPVRRHPACDHTAFTTTKNLFVVLYSGFIIFKK